MSHEHSSTPALEEIDLAVSDMNSPGEQLHAQQVLQALPAIRGMRFVERGIWISYNPVGIAPGQIVSALRNAGFRASVFQASETGQTGSASF